MADENYDIEIDDPAVRAKMGKLKRQRNLQQYKGMSDEDFDKILTEKALGIEISEEFEKRIQSRLNEFGEDYDLSDLKINDKLSLRALIQAIIGLEEYEQHIFKIRKEGINQDAAFKIEKLQRIMSELRADISKIQSDLNITRKIRKSDQDVSVMAFIDNLKDKARKFYESKMSFIYCDCGMLLSTVWVLYPEEDNVIKLKCHRTLDDGKPCGKVTKISTKELYKNRGTNNKEITPESML